MSAGDAEKNDLLIPQSKFFKQQTNTVILHSFNGVLVL